jgi:hypothetical protein
MKQPVNVTNYQMKHGKYTREPFITVSVGEIETGPESLTYVTCGPSKFEGSHVTQSSRGALRKSVTLS